jgi:hypothetical protein
MRPMAEFAALTATSIPGFGAKARSMSRAVKGFT